MSLICAVRLVLSVNVWGHDGMVAAKTMQSGFACFLQIMTVAMFVVLRLELQLCLTNNILHCSTAVLGA